MFFTGTETLPYREVAAGVIGVAQFTAERPRPGEERKVASTTQKQVKDQGPQLPWTWYSTPSPSHRLDRAVPVRLPLPMPLVESHANDRLPGKPPSLPVTQPHGRLSPLLLLIGHDQARVQDVLFWLPRAVPGRETRGQSCPAPHWILRGHRCSTRAHCLKPSPHGAVLGHPG